MKRIGWVLAIAAAVSAWSVAGHVANAYQEKQKGGQPGKEENRAAEKATPGKTGVQGTLLRIDQSGSYEVTVGEEVEIDLSAPIPIGSANRFTVSVSGQPDVLTDEKSVAIVRQPIPVDVLTFGAFLKANRPGQSRVMVSFGRPQPSIRADIRVVRRTPPAPAK
jgi:hypothetical protein